MPTIYSEPSQTEPKHYKADAKASDADIEETGGEKSLVIQNALFQSDSDSQIIAEALLVRLKTRKTYFQASSEFMPVPVERRDSITIQERVTHEKDINHVGLIRGIKLDITQNSQVLTLTLEE